MRGKALRFDGVEGVNGYNLTIPDDDSLEGMSELTITAWVYLHGRKEWSRIVSKEYYNAPPYVDDSYMLLLDENDEKAYMRIYLDDGTRPSSGYSTSNIALREWTFIAGTYNGSDMAIYVNGVKENSSITTGIINKSTVPLTIGNSGDGNQALNGSIDEVTIWKRALSPEEINASYQAGLYKLYHNFTSIPTGTYTYKAYAVDQAGNMNETEEKTVKIYPNITWTGNTDTDWHTAANWDAGIVPTATDTVIIPNVANKPILSQHTKISSLYIQSSSSAELYGYNFNATSSFSNSGSFILLGNETVNLTMDTDSGTIYYNGNDTYSDLAAGDNYYELIFEGDGSWTMDHNLAVNYNFNQNNGTFDANGYNLTITNNFTVSNCKFWAGEGVIKVSESWDSSSGTYNGQSAMVDINGTGTFKMTTTSPWNYEPYKLKCAGAGQTTTLLSTVWTNTLETGSGTITDGTSSYSIIIHGSGDVFIDGGATFNFNGFYYRPGGTSTQNVVGRDYTGVNSLRCYGVGDGSGQNYCSMQGNVTANAVYIYANNNDAGDTKTAVLKTNGFNLTATSLIAGSATYNWGGLEAGSSTVDINGDVQFVVAGESYILANVSTWYVSGDFDNSPGANFSAGNSTFIFDGTSSSTFKGNNTFHNLTSETEDKVLNLTVSSIQTVDGMLRLKGSGSGNVTIVSTIDGSFAGLKLKLGSDQEISYTAARDINSSGGIAINATDGTNHDLGNNINWNFYAPNHTQPYLNATDLLNTTVANLTCFNQSTNDSDGDYVVNSYAWYKDSVLDATMMPKKESLLLYMPFDNEEPDNIVYDYALDNDGNNTGSTWTNAGKIDGAYEFDGKSGYISVERDIGALSAGTLSFWVKFNCFSCGWEGMISQSSAGTFITFNYGDGTGISVFENSSKTITVPENNTWYYLTLTWNSSERRAYMNGVLENRTASSYSTTFSNIWIGKYLDSNYVFNGSIDEVMIWSTSLHESDVSQLYHSMAYGKGVMDSSRTSKGDSWVCEITPRDMYAEGTAKNSTTLNVASDNLTVSLTSPLHNWYVNDTIRFECSVTNDYELSNTTLYHNYSGSFVVNGSLNVSGTSVDVMFNRTDFSNNSRSFVWNCYACDSEGECGYASSNNTLTIDLKKPSINFTNPTSGNNTRTAEDNAYINVSVSDNYNNYSAFIDWNRSLVGWWRFEEDGGSSMGDSSSWSNDGSCTGSACPEWITGMRGKAVRFDGGGDYVDCGSGNSLNIVQHITISFWAKPTGGIGDYTAFLGRGLSSSWGFYGDSGIPPSNIYFRVITGDGTVTASSSNIFEIGKWTHIVGVYNGTNIDIYGDGVEITSADYAQTGVMDNSGTTLQISKISDRASYFFNGTIDEVMIFDRALSPEEINASYQAGIYRLYHNFTNLSAGTYTYKAYAVDQAGNLNETEERTLTVNTAPTVSLTSPLHNWYVNDSIRFECNASDDYNLTNVTLYTNYSGSFIANGSLNISGTSVDVMFNRTDFSNNSRSFTWNCYACDSDGECSYASSNRTLTIDLKKPGINFTNPSPGNNTRTTNDWAYINVSVSDNYNNYSAFIDWNRSLVGWWRFEEDGGNITYDSSTYDNNGGCNSSGANCPEWTTGMRGKALRFDGVDDYVSVGYASIFNLTQRLTIEAWVKPLNNIGGKGAIVTKSFQNYDYTLKYENNVLQARLISEGSSYYTIKSGSLSGGEWQHIALTWDKTEDSGKGKIYVNGAEAAYSQQDPLTSDLDSMESNLFIGGDRVGVGSYAFNGTIDEVKIFSRALSPEEINASYNAKRECYDNKTEIMTSEGWKYFNDVSFEDKIFTLNSSSGDIELHNPERILDYYYNGEMYNVETEKGNLLVSPEHKVYVSERDKEEDLVSFVMMDKSFEDYGVLFNLESEDKASNMNPFVIPQAMPKVLEMLNRIFITRYDLLDLLVDCGSKDIIFPSNLQEYLLQVGRNNKFKSHFKPSNLCNSFKVIGLPAGSFLAFFNSSINSFFIGNSSTGCQSILSQNSWSSGDNLWDFIYSSNISFLRDSSLLISDQLIQGNDIILALNSSDTDKVIDAIYISPLLTSSWNFSNCFNLTANRSFKYSAQFMSGCLSNFFFNSSGIDTVKVAILIPPNVYGGVQETCFSVPPLDFVNTLKFVNIYKSFDLSGYKLTKISEIYGNFGNKQLTFLDESGNEIKVNKISRRNYNGRIYDVTVPNHIILVRRDGLITWSGNSFNGVYHNFTSLSAGNYTYKAYAVDQAGNMNETEERIVTIEDDLPTWNNNQTNAPGKINDQRWFFVNWSDDRGLSSYIFSWNGTNGVWTNDSAVALTGTINQSNVTKTINLTRGKNIGWRFYANDTNNQWNVTDIFIFSVENTPPEAVNLSMPINKSSITERQPFFNWTSAYDVDGDVINYTLLLVESSSCSGNGLECLGVDVEEYIHNKTNFTSKRILGVDTWYNWTVRAYDGYNYSSWSEGMNFSVLGKISLTLDCVGCNDAIEFGSVVNGLTYNATEAGSDPEPLVFENNGNVFVDVQVNATTLWDTAALDTVYFQFMAGNSSEDKSFNWSNSTTAWANIDSSLRDAVTYLNYTNATDLAEIEFRIRVPNDEPAGVKSSALMLRARYWNAS
ncbi:MAG: hypothetical protein KAK00_10035 [Nanoarchaeota archaeon]|nr:hypothetical protein [Nanoarchaeota archaeon]